MNWDIKKSVIFSKEERDFIYYQLLSRLDFFEKEIIEAANRKDLNKVIECSKAIEMIQQINKKLLN